MEKYYLELIRKHYTDLRSSLITAICYYLEKDVQLSGEICKGDESAINKIIEIEPAFNSREHVIGRKTVVTFETTDSDGLFYRHQKYLSDLSVEWLIAIYERLSKNRLIVVS